MFNKIAKFVLSSSLLFIISSAFLLQGCARFDGSEDQMDAPAPVTENQPYYSKEFRELLIPDGLALDREATMFIKTDSFNGGILTFRGRLEVNSLADFFETSMQKEGWKFAGSVKSQKSLLIFTKSGKSCMIIIHDSDFTINTEVNIYITEEKMGHSSSYTAPPATEEIIN